MRRALLIAASIALPPAVVRAQGSQDMSAVVAPNVTRADLDFLTGMIAHHAQAVMMARWAPSHGAGGAVLDLCGRIGVAQVDEIRTFQRYLREHHLAVPEPDTVWHGAAAAAAMANMPGMPMLMPGMLSAAQLAELDSVRGPDFDKLFLLDMIQHHQGAITMVHDLLAVPGAAHDNLIYRIASDVNVDQTTEIERMRRMLMPLLTGGDHQ